jgi:hypothetical protein
MALELQRRRDDQPKNFAGLGLHVIDTNSRPALADMDGLLWERRLQGPGGSPTILTSTLLGRRGDEVVELTWFDVGADVGWVESLFK